LQQTSAGVFVVCDPTHTMQITYELVLHP